MNTSFIYEKKPVFRAFSYFPFPQLYKISILYNWLHSRQLASAWKAARHFPLPPRAAFLRAYKMRVLYSCARFRPAAHGFGRLWCCSSFRLLPFFLFWFMPPPRPRATAAEAPFRFFEKNAAKRRLFFKKRLTFCRATAILFTGIPLTHSVIRHSP